MGRGRKPTHRLRNQGETREKPPDGGDGAARQGATETTDAEMEAEEGAGGAGHQPKHSTDVAAATSESDTHPCREYGKEASEASVGGQASAGPAPAEDGHGATSHRERAQREEGGGRKHQESELGERNSLQGDGGEGPPRTVTHA